MILVTYLKKKVLKKLNLQVNRILKCNFWESSNELKKCLITLIDNYIYYFW